MRTIKFRGKSIMTGEWFYGNLYVKDTTGRTHITTPERGCLNINPETVGQFTGIFDKDGKEIYEGDIIRGSNGSINGYECPFKTQIKWLNDGCEFNTPNWGYTDSTHYFKVIGNIHDNPELLKGSSDKEKQL